MITESQLYAALVKAFTIEAEETGTLFRPVNAEKFPDGTSFFIDGSPDLMEIARNTLSALQ